MTEVIELAPGEIDRIAGVSTGGAAEQMFRQDGGQAAPAEMSSDQQAGIKDLATMRQRAGDPSLTSEQRSVILAKMSELSRHVFQGAKNPSWRGDQTPDARTTSNETYNPMAETFAGASDVMTSAEREHLVTHGKVIGLTAAGSASVANFVTKAQLDRVTAKTVMNRAAQHYSSGWTGALSAEDHQELGAECVRRFGSVEKQQTETALAAAYLKHVGLLAWSEKHFGSLYYDPPTLLALAFKARCLGLQPKK